MFPDCPQMARPQQHLVRTDALSTPTLLAAICSDLTGPASPLLHLIRLIVGTRLQAESQQIRSAGQLPPNRLRDLAALSDLGIQRPASLAQDRTPLRRRFGVCLAVQKRRLAVSDQ